MSQLWTPGQQKAAINFELLVMPDTSITLRINGLALPPMPAEQISSLAANLEQAAQRAIALRIPAEVPNGSIPQVDRPRQIIS